MSSGRQYHSRPLRNPGAESDSHERQRQAWRTVQLEYVVRPYLHIYSIHTRVSVSTTYICTYFLRGWGVDEYAITPLIDCRAGERERDFNIHELKMN